MPKQGKKTPKKVEYENSESDQIDSAASEENVSGAEESSEEDVEDGAALAEQSSDEDEEEASALAEESSDEADEEAPALADESSDEDEEVAPALAEESSDEDEEVAPALDASDTESDEDEEEVSAEDNDESDQEEDEKMDVNDDSEDEVDDEEDVPKEKTIVAPATTVGKKKKLPAEKKKAGKKEDNSSENLVERITKQLKETYKDRTGLQLFIKFPEKLPEDHAVLEEKVKSIAPLVARVRRPRQQHARFCLVDFKSKEDRGKTFQELSEDNDSKVTVSLPRVEEEGYIERMAQKRADHIEVMRAKMILKKHAKKSAIERRFTSNIVVYNIPKSASVAQLKELFPDAVNIQIKQASQKFIGVCTAVITCNSTHSASKNQQRKLFLGENRLLIRFDKKQMVRHPPKSTGVGSKPVIGKKRLSDGDGEEQVAEKKAKVANSPQKLNGNAKTDPVAEEKTTAKTPQKKQKQKLNGSVEEKSEVPVEEKAPAKTPKKKQKLNGSADETPEVAVEDKTPAKSPKKKQKQKLNGSVAEKAEVAVEEKTPAKTPQKKQKLNGSAAEKPAVAAEKKTPAKTPKKKQGLPLTQETASANGNSPQKKGGVVKSKLTGKSPLKKQTPAKKAKVAK